MCLYDDQRDLLGQIKAELRAGEASDYEKRAAEHSATRAAEQVDRLGRSLGRDPNFRIAEAVKERVGQRRGGAREGRRDFYLRVVDQLFGASAAADPVLGLVAQCGKTPLSSEHNRELFRVDWLARTIGHERGFARAFAEKTGSHSACVARRLARDLWELRKQHLGVKPQRVLDRPDELEQLVETMAAYRVPCPQIQEDELRRLIGTREPRPIYEAWAAERRAHAITRKPARRGEIEAELEAFEADYGEDIAGAFVGDVFAENRGLEHRYTPNAAELLPTPLHLVCVVLLR
jgi:hypothetical protein